MFINNFKSFSKKILTHKISFPLVLIFFILFSISYSLPNLILPNTLPTKYIEKVRPEEIEENADLYLLSTQDGYLHALNNKKQEIWKAYLDEKLMSCSELNPKQISKNEYLFPFNEQLYIIKDYREFRPFDAYIKDLVQKHYVTFDDLALIGKIKTTLFIIDSENGEILQKIDEDSNFVSNKKIYIRQKNRRKKTLTVVRVDYILNCVRIIDEEKLWNASYSDILIKKGNEFDNWDDNNFFIDTNFVKKFINSYKNNNIENSEINFDELVTAYAYFDKEDIPNIKIFDKSLSSKNLNLLEKKRMSERIRYGNYLIGENEGDINGLNKILIHIEDNFIFIIIIFILCFIIIFILYYYKRKMKINNINNEKKTEKNGKKELIEKEQHIKEENEENEEIKNINNNKLEKLNTNTTEESKDFLEENKNAKEEIKEKIDDEKEKEITISDEKNEISINNINEEEMENDKDKDNNKEKSRIKNSIWDSDEEEDEIDEKSKTKTKKIIKTISNKSKEKSKTKTIKDGNNEEIDEEEDEEEEEENDEENGENKIEIPTEKKLKKDEESNKNVIFENKKEKEKIKKKTRLDTDFENLEKIGEGGYGFVLKGTHRIDKYIYAIKIINISDFNNCAEIDEIVNEANKMSMIKDKYIVNYNICWYEDNLGSAEKFYEKKEEDSNSKSSSILLKEEKNGHKSNNSTKLINQKSKMDNLRSLYCTSFRDDSKLLNTSIFSMKYKNKFFMILMEYCDGNTLEDLIRKHANNSTPIDRKLIYNYTKQILKGLKVLHRNGIIHSDIKPGNIFLKKVGEIEQIKIGDFGMATLKKGENELKSRDIKGYTPLYSAPEQKNKKGTYNEKIDIYACGLILYELIGCFGTNAEKYRAFDELKADGKIFDYIENKYKEESELIKIMTKKDYDERPSAEEILGNNIFKELGKIVNTQ